MKNYCYYKYYLTLLCLLISSFSSYSQNSEKEILKGMHAFSSHQLEEIVKELSADKYAGRLGGSCEYDSSANWLARKFRKYNIKPLGDNGSYLQWYKIPYTKVFKGCELKLRIPVKGGELIKDYKYISEFIPGATSGNGKVKAEVIYAGYGITAPELNYDDYKKVDVKGKIILIEREVPLAPLDNPELFKKWEPYSYHQYKLKNAIDHGAIGMIYNYGPITNPNNDYYKGFIYTHVGNAVVEDMFKGHKNSHKETIDIIKNDFKPQSFKTGKIVSIKNNTRHFPDGRSSNVIAWIEGNDPNLKNEYILVGAHLDHVGQCWETMPGANDNASGIAVILEIARILKEYNIKLKRSIVFIAFGSEEQGIIGAKHYLENPVVPLKQTIGLINLDGVGSGDKISITAGKNFPQLYEAMDEANQKYIHREMRPNKFLNISRPRLDAARFMKAGIPILSFGAYGNPKTWKVYHQPGDNMEIIDPEIMEDIAQLVYLGLIKLANK